MPVVRLPRGQQELVTQIRNISALKGLHHEWESMCETKTKKSARMGKKKEKEEQKTKRTITRHKIKYDGTIYDRL